MDGLDAIRYPITCSKIVVAWEPKRSIFSFLYYSTMKEARGKFFKAELTFLLFRWVRVAKC